MGWETPLEFRIEGKPMPQERPYFVNRRAFDRPKSKTAKDEIGFRARLAMGKSGKKILSGSVNLSLSFVGAHASADIDNLAKLVQDAGTGIIWEDDRQIKELYCMKRPTFKDEKPFTSITVMAWSE